MSYTYTVKEGAALTFRKSLIFTALISFLFLSGSGIFAFSLKDDISNAAGARAAGMGGAFTAIADDYSAFYYNPGGLVLAERSNASIDYNSVFSGTQPGIFLNYSQPFFDGSAVAISYFDGTVSGSKFSNSALYLSYATYLDDAKTYSMGANFKYLSTGMSGQDIYGRAGSLDIGVMVFPDILEKKLKFGFLAQDMDAVIAWNSGERQRIPLLFKMGSSYAYDKTTSADLDIDILQSDAGRDHSRTGVHIGAEKWFMNGTIGNFGVRGGFYWREAVEQNGKFSFGASYGREDFVLDYVYIPDYDNFGDTHKISVSYFFWSRGDFERKFGEKNPVPEAKKPEEKKAEPAAAGERFKYMELAISQKYVSSAKGSAMGQVDLTLKGAPPDMTGLEWSLDISNSKGGIVKQMKGSGPVPPVFSWKGDDNSGAAVIDGDYTASLELKAGGVQVWQKAKVITVDATPPTFELVLYPKVFAPVKTSRINELTLDIRTKFSDIKSWTFTVKDEKSSSIRKMSGDGITGKLSWNGRDALDNIVKDGEYEAVVSMQDYAGNSFSLSEPFTVDTYISRFAPKADIRIFKAGKDSVIITPGFAEPDRIKSWDLEIFGGNNKLLKSFKNRPVSMKKISWDGTDDKNAGVRAGSVFRYRVTVYQKNEITNYKDGVIETALPEFKDAGIELTLAAIDFEAGDKSIPTAEYGYLNQASEAVKKYAKEYFVFIKGSANDSGSAEDNLRLSIDRAEAVRDYLVTAQGVPEANIYIIGYGDGEYAGQAEKDGIAKAGKRVEVELLTK
jgi:outer membrane protein OmpA-like peptidoglycan-associated protein